MDEIGEYMELVKTLNEEELRRAVENISNMPDAVTTDSMQNMLLALVAEMNRRGTTMNGDPRIQYGALFITDNLRIFTESPVRIEAMLKGWQAVYKKHKGYMVSDNDKTPHYSFEDTYTDAEKALAKIYKQGHIDATYR